MTELVDLLMKGGPWTVAAVAIGWAWTLYRDLRARDAQIFALLEKQLRLIGDGKE